MSKLQSEGKTERKNLPDVLDSLKDDQNEQHLAISLLERGHEIKCLLGTERDKKTGKPLKGEPNYGLLAELADIKDELNMIQQSNDLAGLRHGRIGAVSTQMDGRQYLDVAALMDAGVSPEQIKEGTKQGDSYFQITLFELKK